MAVHTVPTDVQNLSQLINKLEGGLPRSNSVRRLFLSAMQHAVCNVSTQAIDRSK